MTHSDLSFRDAEQSGFRGHGDEGHDHAGHDHDVIPVRRRARGVHIEPSPV
ncbi:hypothetical protein [Microcella sp.]|uniref:hypothetical protein n=1 Tax=Microcella sp. TaxID=1913979 RepID=UPI00299F6652|nr:hypothetical protein [Microcella sp.]MDX2025921.1 hypothetical protein [Microcella sp.]